MRELAVKVENKLAERGGRRPAGGVNVAPKSTKKTEEEDVVQDLLVRAASVLQTSGCQTLCLWARLGVPGDFGGIQCLS